MLSCKHVLFSLALLFFIRKSQGIPGINRLEEDEAPSAPNIGIKNINNSTTTRPVQERTAMDISSPWSLGIIPYYIDSDSYDDIIEERINSAMTLIERSSCLIFNNLLKVPTDNSFMWLHFTNPKKERDCLHRVKPGNNSAVIVTLGFECMLPMNIMHEILHGLGFHHEVTHPHRDRYIRILWENIQPKYRSFFLSVPETFPNRPVVEYDPQSVMHFHDRAYSINGEPTIAPLIPGLVIQPSERLSQLDKMKLKLYFSHECNQRKVDNLIDDCRNLLLGKPEEKIDAKNQDNQISNEVDKQRGLETSREKPDAYYDPDELKKQGDDIYEMATDPAIRPRDTIAELRNNNRNSEE